MSSESESNVEITRSTFLSCERMLSLSIEFSCFNSFLSQVSSSNSTHVHLKYVDLDSEGKYSIVLTVTQDCIYNSISISIFMTFLSWYRFIDFSGIFSCEVSTESPSYQSLRAEEIMQVYGECFLSLHPLMILCIL